MGAVLSGVHRVGQGDRVANVANARPTGRLLVAARGFAGCSMPSYDRAPLRAACLCRLLVGDGGRRRWHGPPGRRSPTHPVRREGLARDLPHDGMEHSPTSATGTGWEATPWHATQRAAWEALTKALAKSGVRLCRRFEAVQ